IAADLDGKDFIVVRSAGETGQLYGSVSTRDIAEFLVEEGFQVARNQVDLKTPIKTIGLHTVDVVLHPEVVTQVTLNVARSTDEAERQAAGEDLTSADAIYGENEEAFESLADFEEEDGPRAPREDAGEDAGEEAPSEEGGEEEAA
ncbi:MAG: 50S ribosomal L9 C-terminal domain-containing protein, partial [Pseudomonadota bacterium]